MQHISTATVATAALVVALGGCRIEPVPVQQTSLALEPGKDPGRPPRRLSLLWLHHSTGDALLDGGLRAGLAANGIDFHDINYTEAKVGDYVIGDHTDPPDFPKTFNTPRYFDVVKGWELKGKKKHHDMIMFKSCFPASKIESDEQLAQYKRWYRSLLPTFKKHPEILFIPLTTPPLVKAWTDAAQGKRARAFAKWLTGEYAAAAPNIAVFDLFDALAVREGFPLENRLVPQFGKGVRDAHPSAAGAKAVTRLFVPWLNRTVRAAGLVGGAGKGGAASRPGAASKPAPSTDRSK